MTHIYSTAQLGDPTTSHFISISSNEKWQKEITKKLPACYYLVLLRITSTTSCFCLFTALHKTNCCKMINITFALSKSAS